MTQPYRSTAETLETLLSELVGKSAAATRDAARLEEDAATSERALDTEKRNRLLGYAEVYRLKAEQIDAAIRVCYDVGTAAETVSP